VNDRVGETASGAEGQQYEHGNRGGAESGQADTRRPAQGRFSLVVAVLNEQETLPAFLARLHKVLPGLSTWDVEVIFVDDGSTDGSLTILKRMQAADSRVKIVRLSRNFGSWNALLAGVHASTGNIVMWLSADLQDPPELIPQLIQRWEEGADVVWAARVERDDPWPRRLLAVLFYKLLRRLSLPEYPPLGMDVCLMDRRVANIFGELKERNRFTQGLIMRLGFKQVMVPYARERRHGGESKWRGLGKLLRSGTDMVAAFSHAPFRIALSVGLLVSFLAAAFGFWLLIRGFVLNTAVGSWTIILWAVVLFGALNLTLFGLLGEYLWRVLEEVRERPLYVVQEMIGFEPASSDRFPPRGELRGTVERLA